MSETAFRNTIYITQGSSEAKAGLADEVRRYMANLQSAGDSEIDVNGALAKLDEQRKALEGGAKARAYAGIREVPGDPDEAGLCTAGDSDSS